MSMHEARLALAIESVLEAEGGYTAIDGGTMAGVTQATYDHFRTKTAPSGDWPKDVGYLERGHVLQIYRWYLTGSSHWHDITKVKPLIPMVMLAHCEVLMGRSAGVRVLQRAAPIPRKNVDGMIGPQTERAISEVEPQLLVTCMHNEWIEKLGRIIDANPEKARFRDGWMNRASGWREGYRP